MSIPGIPGLGQLASTQVRAAPNLFLRPCLFFCPPRSQLNDDRRPQAPPPSATRTITLQPLTEWRFQAAHAPSPPLQLRLLSGTAERDGTELAPQRTYTLAGAASKILTWHGCTLEVSGPCDAAHTAAAEPAGAIAALNLAFALRRGGGGATQPGPGPGPGPRVLVCGGPTTGKSTLARTLVALGVRGGAQPLLASVDPRDGMLSLPGTVSVAAFATRLDVESADGGVGVGGTPSSGPSAVPVKVPLVYFVGRERPGQDMALWRELTGLLGRAALERMRGDGEVGRAGLVVDAPGTAEGEGTEMLEHVVQAFDGALRACAQDERGLVEMLTDRGVQ